MNNVSIEYRASSQDQLNVIERVLSEPDAISPTLNLIWDQVQEYKQAIAAFNRGMRYNRISTLEREHRELLERLRGESLDRDELAAKAMLQALRERAKRTRAAMKITH